MAIFNPTIDNNKPNEMLGYSQGVRVTPAQDAPPAPAVDRSKELRLKSKAAFWSDLGTLFGEAVKATDAVVQNYIQGEAEDQISQVRDEFGVGAAALQQADATLQPQPLPEQLQAAGDSLQGLSSAYQSGRLKESHYWARLESVTRQLKTRFPGYTTEIDRMVEGIAGATPANALRRTLLNEAQDELQARANDPVAKQVDEMSKDGSLLYYPEIVKRLQNGEAVPLLELQLAQGRVTNMKSQNEMARNELALKADQKKDVSTEAIDVATREASQRVDVISKQFYAGFGGEDKFNQSIAELTQQYSEGKAPDKDQLLRLHGMVANLQHTAEMATDGMLFDNYTGRKPGDPVLTAEQRADVKKRVMEKVDAITTFLSDQKFNLFGAATTQAKLSVDSRAADLLGNDTVQTVAAISKTLGSDVANTYLMQAPGALGALTTGLENAASARLLAGKSGGLLKEIDTYTKAFQADGQTPDPEAYLSLTKNMARAVADDRIPPTEKAKLLEQLFSGDNRTVAAHFPAASRARLYEQFTSPEVLQGMLKAKAQGLTQGWNSYVDWVKQSFIALHQEAGDNVRKGIVDLSRVTIHFDPNDLHLSAHLNNPSTNSSGANYLWQQYNWPAVRDSVALLNRQIDTLRPILEANGEDPTAAVQDLLLAMRVDPNAPKDNSSILDTLFAYLKSTAAGGGASNESVDQSGP